MLICVAAVVFYISHRDNNSALHEAIIIGDVARVEEAFAKVTEANALQGELTLLESGNADCVRIFLAAGARPNADSRDRSEVLNASAGDGDTRLL